MNKSKKPLILSVDDDHDILKLIEKYVSESGFNIVTFDRIDKARAFINESTPDLILVDVKMPQSNGYEFSRSLQNDKKLSSVPVVFLTAMQREQDKAQAFASGAVDYLIKPIQREKLINVIKKYLRKKKEWDAIHEKKIFPGGTDFSPHLKNFREFLSAKLRLPFSGRDKISNSGIIQLYAIAPQLGIADHQLAKFIAEHTHLSYLPLINPMDIQPGILPVTFCRKNFVVPAKDEQGKLVFILSDPFNLELIDILRKKLPSAGEGKFMISTPETIGSILKYNPEVSDKKINFVKNNQKAGLNKKEDPINLLQTTLEDRPTAYITDQIIDFASSERASDIHIEPKEKETLVRLRIDGSMQNVYSINNKSGKMIISRFKAIGGLDITERRRPQDGVVDAFSKGKKLRLRMATTATHYGESLIIRLLEPGSKPKSLESLGMTDNQIKTMIDFTNQPQGLLLVVGQIGSGKTTTLYSSLFQMNYKNQSLISIEDPVEYEIPWANQQQVNEKAGVTFKTLLKSALRQDPDILFLGEIRDQYSANIAMDFASTGHLILTTLHTSNTTTALFRLERLGIQRETIADAVIGIVAQKLLKKLCHYCRETVPISKEEIKMLSPYTDDIPSRVARPVGCSKCNFTGFCGREGVFEIVKYDKDVLEVIRSGKDISKIRKFMRSRGDYLISDHALDKLKKFDFSPKEVYEEVLVEDNSFDKIIRHSIKRPSVKMDKKLENKKSVLIVEDDKDTQKLIAHLLERQGYLVSTSNNGIEALRFLAERDFNLIISDVAMPNLDGLKLIELIRQKGIETPVIFLSALDKEEDVIKGLKSGAEDYLKKPVQKEILLLKVKKAFEN